MAPFAPAIRRTSDEWCVRATGAGAAGRYQRAVYPWNTGGKEVRHHELLTRLARGQFVVTIYTMRWWEGGRSTVVDGIRYVAICPRLQLYVGRRRSILQALIFALCTLSVVVRRFDVVEVDAIPFLPLFPMRLVTWARRAPMVVTWHEFWGAGYWAQYLGRRGVVASTIERAAARLPSSIIAASDGTAERLRVSGLANSVHVVPNGVDVDALRSFVTPPMRDWPATRPSWWSWGGFSTTSGWTLR